MDELRVLGQNLRRFRAGKGLTQAELGLRVELTKDTISKIELGKQENVGLKYLVSICRVLEVDLEQLVATNARTIPINLHVSDGNVRALGEIVERVQKILAGKEEP